MPLSSKHDRACRKRALIALYDLRRSRCTFRLYVLNAPQCGNLFVLPFEYLNEAFAVEDKHASDASGFPDIGVG